MSFIIIHHLHLISYYPNNFCASNIVVTLTESKNMLEAHKLDNLVFNFKFLYSKDRQGLSQKYLIEMSRKLNKKKKIELINLFLGILGIANG